MELSDPASPDHSANDATNRRTSGRAKQKPVLYQQDPNISVVSNSNGKRKHVELPGGDDGSQKEDGSAEDSSIDGSDGDPDEEELKEKRRKAPKAKKGPVKPAVKKARTRNDVTTKLPIRPATNGVRKPAKPRKPRARQPAVEQAGTGLYGKRPYLSMADTSS